MKVDAKTRAQLDEYLADKNKTNGNEVRFRTYTCLTSKMTVTSPCILDEDVCCRVCNLHVFSHVQKGTPGLAHERYVLRHVSLGAFSDVTVILGMRQSIESTEVSRL